MKDSELEAMLRAARLPEKSEEYWDAFPGELARRASRPRMERTPPPRLALASLAWGGALTMACVVLGFGLGQVNGHALRGVWREEHKWREELAVVPHQLCAMMQPERGMQWLVADAP
ncbi:MAG TPA: hypothetical protein VHB20_16300 [Verrucomicrobiae bacterium]|jgi:hypothetical protein|nr:hypothetical protein [Verrucomicrobiae bacterium]